MTTASSHEPAAPVEIIAPVSEQPASEPAAESAPPLKLQVVAPSREIPLFNREFSWLEFDRRVLAEAESESVPLLERLKFLSITSTNLDEFNMVRLGGIKDLIAAGIVDRSADGLTPQQQLDGIRTRVARLFSDQYRCLNVVLGKLQRHGIRIEKNAAFSRQEQSDFRQQFETKIAPILTPLAFDPGHPFPFMPNLSLNIAVTLETSRGDEHIAFVRLPSTMPRFLAAPGTNRYLPLESLVAEHVGTFFPGLRVKSAVPFRVIRNADLSIREEEVQDLLQSVESELRRRDRKQVVVMEIDERADESLIDLLTRATQISRDDVTLVPGLLRLGDLMQIYAVVDGPEGLKDPSFNPRIPIELALNEDIFSIIRRQDLLLQRPYESFSTVVEFVQASASDPDVAAIKMTLYRTDEGSPIVEALIAAALAGKQVTAVVELQARFDELKNITWARRLETAGVQVVYGLVGIKTHCKLCLVVRREPTELRRYVHLSTGNYNARTAKIYTDIDLFTCDPSFGEDAAQLFNLLTGFSIGSVQEIFEHQAELRWKQFVVSPIDYQRFVIRSISELTEVARSGKPARIVAKLNALVDPATIEKLYEASRAGVKIDLILRGICCLVPGLPGFSENIRVLSVVDKFLEHSRIFLFEAGGEQKVYVSSGDWMPRNFLRRVEATFPILSPELRKHLSEEILATSLADNVKGWRLQSDGSYRRRDPKDNIPLRSQDRFIEITRSESVRVGPYDEIIRRPGSFRRKAKKQREKGKKK